MYKRELNSLKRLLAVILSGAVLLSAGCGGNNAKDAAGEARSATKKASDTGSSEDGSGAAGGEADAEGSEDGSGAAGDSEGSESGANAEGSESDSNAADGAGNADETSEGAAKLSEEELYSTLDFTYTSHPMALMNGYTQYASANYYTIELEKGVKDKFENLQKVLDKYNKDGEEAVGVFFTNNADDIKEMFDNDWGLAYEEDRMLTPVRADGRVFSYVMGVYTYLAGAHGFMSFANYNYDPVTGEEIQFSDVVKNTENLPEIIVSELEKQNTDLAKSFADMPSDRENLVNGIPDRYDNNASGLSWAIDYDGIWCYFEDYAMGYYALGAQSVKIKFADYPEVFTDTYDNYKDKEIPDIAQIGRELKEAEIVNVDAEPLFGKGSASDGSGSGSDGSDGADSGEGEDWWYHAVVKNPGWSDWTADGIDTEVGKPSYDLSEVSSNTTDWLNEDKWSKDNGIPLPPSFPYDDGDYSFSVTNEAESGNMSLTVYNHETSTLEGNYFFDEFLNPPDQGEGMFAEFTEPAIQYALVKDNVLYVSLGHRTYASANPHKSYIVAIDMVSGETLWRSDDQVCGSYNFVILGDSIYCGYGFTDEPDYIYVLNLKNGKVQKKIKVKSAPYYFIVQEEYMYVLTYNTEYLYKLVD